MAYNCRAWDVSRMQARMQALVIALGGLILTGCAYTVDFSAPKKASPPIYNVEPISVCLSDELKNLTEQVSSWGDRATLYVGKALQLVFKDDKNSVIRLELINNQISLGSGEGMLWDTKTNYLFSVSLNNNGTKTTIYAQGNSKTLRSIATSAQYAVENAVYDLYKQVKFHVSEDKK